MNAPVDAAFVPAMRVGDAVPAIVLRDQRNRPFSFADVRGRVVVVAFVFTRCREAGECPLTTAKFAQLQARSRGSDVALVEVTLDPEYDSPRVLARYAARFVRARDAWEFVGGEPRNVRALLTRFGVTVRRGGSDGIVHSAPLAIVDASGHLALVLDDTAWSVDGALAAAREVAGDDDVPARLVRFFESGYASMCGGRAGGVTNSVALAIFAALVVAFVALARRLRIRGA